MKRIVPGSTTRPGSASLLGLLDGDYIKELRTRMGK